MQSEQYLDTDRETITPEKPRKPVSALWLWTHGLVFAVGLTLLVWLVYRYWDDINKSVLNVGWGIVVVLALNLARHFGRAFSMYMAVSPDHRNFKYRNALLARFGG